MAGFRSIYTRVLGDCSQQMKLRHMCHPDKHRHTFALQLAWHAQPHVSWEALTVSVAAKVAEKPCILCCANSTYSGRPLVRKNFIRKKGSPVPEN